MRQKLGLDKRRARGLVATLAAPFLGGCLLSGCTTSGDSEGIEGTLVSYTARYDEGFAETLYALRVGEEERPLVFAEPPSEIGSTVRVWGRTTDRGIEVDRLQ